MKQEILCLDCKKSARESYPNDNPYPGEHIKFVDGKAFKRYLCDHCDKQINQGEDCSCFSIWADHGADPYSPWEKDYIEVVQMNY